MKIHARGEEGGNGGIGDWREKLPFDPDCFAEPDVGVCKRVAAAGFGIALQQYRIVGAQEQHVDFEILRAQRFEVFRKAGNFRSGFACIDADRQLLVATVAAPQRAAEVWADQLQGQIDRQSTRLKSSPYGATRTQSSA